MPSTVRASVEGIAQIRADLQAVRIGLDREISKVLKEAAGIAAEGAEPLTPYDPEHVANRKDGLPHIRDSFYAVAFQTTAAVASRHPGAVLHEYGGTIAPNGHPITIRQQGMAHEAGRAALPAISDLLEQRVNALVSQHFPR